MSDTAELKRGDKQLVALDIINGLKENYKFEDLTKAVGEACFPGKEDAEPQARHLIRYLVKYQDRIAEGKKQTLRDQGRIICPSWYVQIENPKTVTDLVGRHIPFADFLLKKPAGRKTPEKKVVETLAPKEVRSTPERRKAIADAFKNFSNKKATARIEEMAKDGAHRFADPETTEADTTKAPASELEGTS